MFPPWRTFVQRAEKKGVPIALLLYRSPSLCYRQSDSLPVVALELEPHGHRAEESGSMGPVGLSSETQRPLHTKTDLFDEPLQAALSHGSKPSLFQSTPSPSEELDEQCKSDKLDELRASDELDESPLSVLPHCERRSHEIKYRPSE